MSVHVGSPVQQPAERRDEPTRARSAVSMSERYLALIDGAGDWFDKSPTSSSVVDRQKPTKVRDPHKPALRLSRELKPDFVIYV